MINLIYDKKFQTTKYQPTIRFNGIKLDSFFAPAEEGRGAESYVKLFQTRKPLVLVNRSLYRERELKKL